MKGRASRAVYMRLQPSLLSPPSDPEEREKKKRQKKKKREQKKTAPAEVNAYCDDINTSSIAKGKGRRFL